MTVIAVPPSSRRGAPAPRHRAVDVLAGSAGLGLGAVTGLAWAGTTPVTFTSAAGVLALTGQTAALVGTYAMLLAVLLAGRLAVLERAVGQDRLVRWHRRLAPWGLGLIVMHVAFSTVAEAAKARNAIAAEAWSLITTTPGMLAAATATGLLLLVGGSSYRRARRRLAHETWWAIHLYTYLALALSLSHQLTTGRAFATTSWARPFWLTLWAGTAGAVLAYRVVLPIARSLMHRLRVESVREEAPGVTVITMRGRALDRLPLSGGQFLQWRFLQPRLWWQAHPYSASALPDGDRIRITVKDLGDHSSALARIPLGTRVAFEGPYGGFTADRRQAHGPGPVLIGAGVGVTPVRALLEDLPEGSDPIVVLRARDHRGLVHLAEIEALAHARGGQVHRVLGSREDVRLDRSTLSPLIPHLEDRDVFVCGPPALTTQVLQAAREAGVPDSRLHHETFAV